MRTNYDNISEMGKLFPSGVPYSAEASRPVRFVNKMSAERKARILAMAQEITAKRSVMP